MGPLRQKGIRLNNLVARFFLGERAAPIAIFHIPALMVKVDAVLLNLQYELFSKICYRGCIFKLIGVGFFKINLLSSSVSPIYHSSSTSVAAMTNV